MVRLRAPARTSVYGFADGTSVTWTLSGTDRAERQVVEVTHTVTAPVVDGAWKVPFKLDMSSDYAEQQYNTVTTDSVLETRR